MAPTKKTKQTRSKKKAGRPNKEWTASRQRKLLRLYFMTDLTKKQTQIVFGDEGFLSSPNNMNAQLKILLGDKYSTEWREYRPSKDQMRVRLSQFKESKKNRVTKYYRRKQADQMYGGLSALNTQASTANAKETCEQLVEGMLPSVPSHKALPPLGITSLSQESRAEDIWPPGGTGNDPYSDKEVVIASELPTFKVDIADSGILHTERANTVHERIADQATSGLNASSSGWRNSSSLIQQTSPIKSTTSPATSVKRLASIKCVDTLSGGLSSRMSSLHHVASVLSSGSWGSSLVYAPSRSSGRPSTPNRASWTREEFNSWNQFVDESVIDSSLVLPLEDEAMSLQSRCCCNFVLMEGGQEMPDCEACGLSNMHIRARVNVYNKSDAPIDPCVTDRFGNTPLHHAAATGNITQVLELMSSTRRPSTSNSQQNSLGETFLHVFRLQGNNQLPQYERILRKASDQGFPFEILDYCGRSITYRLGELLNHWDLLSNPQSIAPAITLITSILKVDGGLTSQDGRLKPGGSDMSWHDYHDTHRPTETKLISTLKNWSRESKTIHDLQKIIQDSNIHMRNRAGYTALAIAAAHGLRDAVFLLLESGANPNTRSFHKTSVMEYAGVHLARAQKEDNNTLYAKILSCMALLSDHGAKANPTVYDEYTMVEKRPADKSKNKGVKLLTKALDTTRKVTHFRKTPRSRTSSKTEQAEDGQPGSKFAVTKWPATNLIAKGVHPPTRIESSYFPKEPVWGLNGLELPAKSASRCSDSSIPTERKNACAKANSDSPDSHVFQPSVWQTESFEVARDVSLPRGKSGPTPPLALQAGKCVNRPPLVYKPESNLENYSPIYPCSSETDELWNYFQNQDNLSGEGNCNSSDRHPSSGLDQDVMPVLNQHGHPTALALLSQSSASSTALPQPCYASRGNDTNNKEHLISHQRIKNRPLNTCIQRSDTAASFQPYSCDHPGCGRRFSCLGSLGFHQRTERHSIVYELPATTSEPKVFNCSTVEFDPKGRWQPSKVPSSATNYQPFSYGDRYPPNNLENHQTPDLSNPPTSQQTSPQLFIISHSISNEMLSRTGSYVYSRESPPTSIVSSRKQELAQASVGVQLKRLPEEKKDSLCTVSMGSKWFSGSEHKTMDIDKRADENSLRIPDGSIEAESFSKPCEGQHQSSKKRDNHQEPFKGTTRARAMSPIDGDESCRRLENAPTSRKLDVNAKQGILLRLEEESSYSYMHGILEAGRESCVSSWDTPITPTDSDCGGFMARVQSVPTMVGDLAMPPNVFDDSSANFFYYRSNCQPIYDAKTFWAPKNGRKNNFIPHLSSPLKRKARPPPDQPPDLVESQTHFRSSLLSNNVSQFFQDEQFRFANNPLYATDWGPADQLDASKRRRVGVDSYVQTSEFHEYDSPEGLSSGSIQDFACNPSASPLDPEPDPAVLEQRPENLLGQASGAQNYGNLDYFPP